jgi:hypothetical protein
MNEGQWCRLKSFVSGQWLLALPFSYPISNNAPKGRNRRVLNFLVVAPYWRRSQNYSSCGMAGKPCPDTNRFQATRLADPNQLWKNSGNPMKIP